MINNLLHTPEGVRDVFPEEYKRKRLLKESLLSVIRGYGYEDIETPTFEYFDVFASNIGTTPSRELYKFFDKEGNTLVLRPDFTPSIARAFSKFYFEESNTVRLCYSGSTFVNGSELRGRLKESTQVGAELYNDDSVNADYEMIKLVIECMKKAGFDNFTISIGNVEFFRGICEELGISDEYETDLRMMLSNKNLFGAAEILDSMNISDPDKEMILNIPAVLNSIDELKALDKRITNAKSQEALHRLAAIFEMLDKNDLSRYISFDLGMLSKYHYYTGVIFRAFTFGAGDAIIKGGRYDNLVKEFGKDSPAIGFCISLDDMLAALSRQ